MTTAYYKVCLGDYCQIVKIIKDNNSYDIEFSFLNLEKDLIKILKEQNVNKMFLNAPKVIYDKIAQLIRDANLKIEMVL